MQQPDFVMIPTQVLMDKSLQSLDRVLFGYIYWLTKLKHEKCTADNVTLAGLAGTKEGSAKNALKRLAKSGWITKIMRNKNERLEIKCNISYGKDKSVNAPAEFTMASEVVSDNTTRSKVVSNHTASGIKSYHQVVSNNTTNDRGETDQGIRIINNNKNKKDNTNVLSSVSHSANVKTTEINEEDRRLARLLAEQVVARYPGLLKGKKPDKIAKSLRASAEAINKLYRLDEHDYPTIERVLRWSQQDEFWQQNIRSGESLRKNFEDLQVKSDSFIQRRIRSGTIIDDDAELRAIRERMKHNVAT